MKACQRRSLQRYILFFFFFFRFCQRMMCEKKKCFFDYWRVKKKDHRFDQHRRRIRVHPAAVERRNHRRATSRGNAVEPGHTLAARLWALRVLQGPPLFLALCVCGDHRGCDGNRCLYGIERGRQFSCFLFFFFLPPPPGGLGGEKETSSGETGGQFFF